MKASLGTAPYGSDITIEMEFDAKRSIVAKEGVITAESAFRSDGIASTARLAERLHRRATEAILWGMPLVKFDSLRQAFFRDAKASYGDIAYWSKRADCNVQWPAPTASAYIYFNFNTKHGPVVFDFPAIPDGGLSGSLFNAREERLVDIGVRGLDRGRGAKFLILPPQFNSVAPAGYFVIRCKTYNGYALLSAPETRSLRSVIHKMQVYPLSSCTNPPTQRLINMSGKVFDASVHFDDTFFDSLARMVNEEPLQPCDLVAMNQIYFLGIEQGKTFRPDFTTREILSRSAGEVHTCLIQSVMNSERWWPSTNWKMGDMVWPRTPFSPEIARRLGIDERNAKFFAAFASPAVPEKGADAFRSVGAFSDEIDAPLQGESSYRLHVPSHVPVRTRWTITAYDLNTACFIRKSPRVAICSTDRSLQKNPDGSVDLHFGPRAPEGKETNWIYTAPKRPWFTVFRMYAPEKAFFERKWVLSNLTRNPE
jgi:hypothetical protein